MKFKGDFSPSPFQLLGRASNIGAFVKRGEDSGHIKISLRGETELEKIVITRKIDTSNRSEWAFNGIFFLMLLIKGQTFMCVVLF